MVTRNNGQNTVKSLIASVPGIHLRLIERLAGISFSSARYHVERLQKAGVVLRERDGGFSRLFPANTPAYEREIFSALRRESNRKVITCLGDHPSISNRQIALFTHLAKSTVSERLAYLKRVGIVEDFDSGVQGVVYCLKDPLTIMSLIVNQKNAFLDKASGRFIDLWDF